MYSLTRRSQQLMRLLCGYAISGTVLLLTVVQKMHSGRGNSARAMLTAAAAVGREVTAMKSKLSAVLAGAVALIIMSAGAAFSDNVGFLYDHGSYSTLNVPSATNTQAFGINNAGQIVG